MIDGITKVIKHSSFLLYADDLKIYRPISSPLDVTLLQEDLDRIQEWLSLNKLSFCPSKCELVSYSRRKKLIPSSYSINNVVIKSLQSKKDLGVTFSSDLSFNLHLKNVKTSCFKSLGFIMRSLYSVQDIDSHLLLFNALILSKLNYAVVVWMPQTDCGTHALETVQASFCRRLFYKVNGFYPSFPNNISYSDLRCHLSLPSISQHHKKILLLFIFKILNNKIDCMELSNTYSYTVPINNTRTSNHTTYFHVPTSSFSSSSPIFRSASLFNNFCSTLDLSSPLNTYLSQIENILEMS